MSEARRPPFDRLWHYTCHHRAALIGQQGVLNPNPQPVLGGLRLVWLTDLAIPDKDALGLTSTTLQCDRTEVRYRVTDGTVVPWREWAETARIDRRAVSELTFGRRPRHWFVSALPVTVERDDLPADCLHPVEARVASSLPIYIARCHDCGLHVNRHAEWVVA